MKNEAVIVEDEKGQKIEMSVPFYPTVITKDFKKNISENFDDDCIPPEKFFITKVKNHFDATHSFKTRTPIGISGKQSTIYTERDTHYSI